MLDFIKKVLKKFEQIGTDEHWVCYLRTRETLINTGVGT